MSYELKVHLSLCNLIKFIILNSSFIIFLSSCSVQKQIARSANKDVLDAVPLQSAHVGISIYEPATNKYWYDYQGDKYFTPASNTKIPTCYAAMKYLGDSLVGLRYFKSDDVYIFPSGDPTFLHPDFKNQPVYNFLSQIKHATFVANSWFGNDLAWGEEALGPGWSWDDFNQPYQSERSKFPINGNCIYFSMSDDRLITFPTQKINIDNSEYVVSSKGNFYIQRYIDYNIFRIEPANTRFLSQSTPFITDDSLIFLILRDTLKNLHLNDQIPVIGTSVYNHDTQETIDYNDSLITIFSQPTGSVLKPMMHRSDNFFAEQILLMVSNERLGVMNDEKIIDTILKTDLKDLPQKPRWVDGSGLSRYNLFTPKDLVFILNKMKNEFGMERVKGIFPTGGQGTLANYYVADSNFIYAKTGTLSGVVALSGYLYTKKGKELIFSVLVNNHQASGTEVRRAVEKFLQRVR